MARGPRPLHKLVTLDDKPGHTRFHPPQHYMSRTALAGHTAPKETP